MNDMLFDPIACQWDRPEGSLYDGQVRIYKQKPGGLIAWARAATPEETLWIADYEVKQHMHYLLQNILLVLQGREAV